MRRCRSSSGRRSGSAWPARPARSRSSRCCRSRPPSRRGPFAGQSPAGTALALQHFLLLRAAPLYLIAILSEQRRGVEQSLRESQERMSLAATAADSWLWEWDLVEDQIWLTNPSGGHDGLGDSPRCASSTFMQRVHPDDRAALTSRPRAMHERHRLRGQISHHARRPVEMDPRRSVTSSSTPRAQPISDPRISRDITHSQRVEQQVQQQRDELAQLSRVAVLGELSGSLGARAESTPERDPHQRAGGAARSRARPGRPEGHSRDSQRHRRGRPARPGSSTGYGSCSSGARDAAPADRHERAGARRAEARAERAGRHRAWTSARSRPPISGRPAAIARPAAAAARQSDHQRLPCHGRGPGAPADGSSSAPGAPTAGACASPSRTRGRAIPPDCLARIFEPFFTTRREGMGLGLHGVPHDHSRAPRNPLGREQRRRRSELSLRLAAGGARPKPSPILRRRS